MSKNYFFVVDISTLLYTLKKKKRKLFSPSKKRFLIPLFQKCIKKVVEFSFTPTKNISI